MKSPVAASPPLRIRVVQEVFNEQEPGMQEYNLEQLDLALEDHSDVVVIEPRRLGAQTLRWIRMGNFLQGLTITAGLAAGITSIGIKYTPSFELPRFVWASLCGLCLASHAAYRLSWSPDPCSEYQPENDEQNLEATLRQINGHRPYCDSYVVMVRRRERNTWLLLTGDLVAVGVAALVAFKLHACWPI